MFRILNLRNVFLLLSLTFSIAQLSATDWDSFLMEIVNNYDETTELEPLVKEFHEKGFKDFTIIGRDTYGLQGEIAGEKCIVALYYLRKSPKIRCVKVRMPIKDSWDLIKQDYMHFKDMFTDIYGRPIYVREMFIDPDVEGSGNEMEAVRNDDYVYDSIWVGNDTIVDLWLESDCAIISFDNNTISNMWGKELRERNNMEEESQE